MRVLELFAGTRSIGKAFEAAGHEVFSVEWDKNFENIDLYADIMTVTAADILEKFGKPDVIWASPDCTTFSVAAISHHRRKNPETGNLDPVSEYAKFCDRVDQHTLKLIRELNPKFYFIENPRGGMRKMTWMQGLPRYTVTYCQYETDKPIKDRRMKPTDIWTNHPDPQFRPMCKNGDPCHAAAPEGAQPAHRASRVQRIGRSFRLLYANISFTSAKHNSSATIAPKSAKSLFFRRFSNERVQELLQESGHPEIQHLVQMG